MSSSRDIRLICLDMDGTLLDPSSSVLESSIEALKLAMERDIRVMLATGKARPAAMAAMEKAGLVGDEMVVGLNTPGIFLQGLQVYGRGGVALQSGALDMDVARRVLEFATARDIAVTCFLGDDCVTPRVTKELEELHYRYYEPYPEELTVEDILRGPPIRKMLMMNDDVGLLQSIRPDMDKQLRQTSAGTMVAVDTMLEVVPKGWNKGTALQTLLRDMEPDGVRVENVMAIGDGANDLEMIVEAGIGVAMGNAVDIVKASADVVVASNDADGIYEAIMKHALS
jgi:Cof subfamily protein (haloacid dehalogenase superfamily)